MMKVLAATGGSPHSAVAIQFCGYLMQLDNNHKPQLTILTVINHEDESAQARTVLNNACQLLELQKPSIQTKIHNQLVNWMPVAAEPGP